MAKASSPNRLLSDEKFLRLYQKSLTLLEQGELEKAQKLLECLSLNPKYELLCLNNLSVTYMKQKIYNKAMVTLLKAYARSKLQKNLKEHLGTLINLTVSASNLNIHEEALNYAQQALLYLTPDNQKVAPIVYYNLGIEYIYLNKYLEAEESLTKAQSSLNECSPDMTLKAMINSALSFAVSHKTLPSEAKVYKILDTCTKKQLRKVQSAGNIQKVSAKKSHKPEKPALFEKHIKTEKSARFTKRAESLASSRAALLILKSSEKHNGSSTSSTESLKNSSYLGSNKSLRKIISSEKSSKHSTPVARGNRLILSNDKKLGSRLQNIGDHLLALEKNMINFTEMCKPLKILAEDPDEQLDSNRIRTHEKANEKLGSPQGLKGKYCIQNIAAIKIQRAYRKYKAGKVAKTLLKFKDNPLFRPNFLSIKGKK